VITFAGISGRSSSEVRGIQIANQIGGSFFDVDTQRFTLGNRFYSNIIFVRVYRRNLAKKIKELSSGESRIGFDIIDRPVADLHKCQRENPIASDIDWSDLIDDLVDYYIVNNIASKKKLEKHILSHQKIYIIPHHVAPDRVWSEKKLKDKVKTIGYIGIKDQLSAKDDISNFCKERNIEFICEHPETREGCVELLSKIDVGIVYLENNIRNDYVIKYKPNTKLSNFQCAGIPAVITEYESFKEFGGECYLVGNTKEEFFKNLSKLVTDKSLRVEMANKGFDVSKNLLLAKVSESYMEISCNE
tara:strand:- start:10237 stop:11145 length:909 start_codon:yes stop_codon:yes gene_type:complete